MKKLYFLKALLLLVACTNMHTIMQAQNFNLIDIDKLKNSWPRNDEFSAKNAYIYFNGYNYFTADDGIHGRELWKTNGTAAGTQMVKDVYPGPNSSDNGNSYDITVSGGKLYFSALDGIHGQGLWVSDGTDAGTHLVADILPGISPNPSYLTDMNGTLYFIVNYFDPNTFISVNQLWKSDGTETGTALVNDFFNGYNLQQLIAVNNKLFFTFYSFFNGAEVYTSDGTPGGLIKLAFFNSFSNFLPTHLTASNGLLYFAADDGTGFGGRLWVSDGTFDGTHPVDNPNNISLPVDYTGFRDSFAIINNVLYFQGTTFDAGNELCKYDESNPSAGVTFVKDIEPGQTSSYPSFMTNVEGTLFFTIGPAGADAQLWKSDGTDAGTVQVKDINPGGINIYYGLTSAYGILIFAYGNNASGIELWKSNGTDAGTTIVKDINAGANWSIPQYITYNNGLFLFGANDGSKGYELWKSNGTTAGTVLIKDINQTSSSSSYPYSLSAMANNKMIFNAGDENIGRELWITDGTNIGTKLLKDINPGAFDGNPNSRGNPGSFLKFKNKTYFFADDPTGFHLWGTNGTAAGTKSIPSGLDNSNIFVLNWLAGNDLIYIVLINFNTSQGEVWRSDGTSAGTYVVKSDIPYNFAIPTTVVGNTLFFTSDDFSVNYGNELWKSEGTVATTGIVKDIIPGPQGSFPFNLFNFNGKLYFGANAGAPTFNNVLWTSDGTGAGTKIVKPLLVQNYPSFAQANGKFFFNGENAVTKGFELFASDGTGAGTKIVKDIAKGANSSGIYNLVSGNKILYFLADDGKHGVELWKSDGTKDGTVLVKNITPGSNGTNTIFPMVNANDQLFFINNDTLWQSDGTKSGTHKIKDAALNGVNNIGNLSYINGYLYFTGSSTAAGNELYAASLSNTLAPVEMVNNTIISNDEKEFSAKLLTNPVLDQLKFTVAVKTQQEARVVITDLSGRIFTSDKQTLTSGINILSYSSSAWAKGIYMINIITSNKFNITLRALK